LKGIHREVFIEIVFKLIKGIFNSLRDWYSILLVYYLFSREYDCIYYLMKSCLSFLGHLQYSTETHFFLENL